MFYFLPTKRGIGVELWGTFDDLDQLYDTISKFWNDEEKEHIRGFENRGKVISTFSYEIRKAMGGFRSKRIRGHFTSTDQVYYGTQLSWVNILFALSALRYNLRFYEINKLESAIFLQLEHWLASAMTSYDPKGAEKLINFIDGGIDGGNDYIYQYMSIINIDYIQLNGGKRAFRQLPELLKKGVFFTEEYMSYKRHLEKEATRLNCDITDMEVDDDHIDYDNFKW